MSRRSANDSVLAARRGGGSARASGREEVRGVGPFGVVPSGLVQPASVGVALAVGAYLSVFLKITDVVGGTDRVALAVFVAALAGVGLARTIDERTAFKLTAALFLVGIAGYYFAVPESQRALLSVRLVALDTVSLLTGLSVLRLTLADVWAFGVAPVPTFLVAYLASRGRHVPAAAVAGGTLGFFVLTGDAGGTTTLAGVVGVALAAGLSTLSAPGGLRSRGDTLAVLLAVMIVASATVTLVPVGGAQPWATDRGTPGLESTLTADDELEIVGSTRLSPEVRFTVESPAEARWHTGSFDTYTGDGWVRSGESTPFEETLEGPPGETDPIEVTVAPATEMEAYPAPWQAVSVDGPGSASATVDDHGTIRPGTPVLEGDRITVESRVPTASPDDLRAADEEYDSAIEDRYTQLPESTPDRVGERTERILEEADADNPYDQAVAIEQYLIDEYDYSLTVERPEGDIADGFLFEMDAGYCTYFATTMVAMLRSQGVPAQFATGYSSGERVDDDEWVVRGQDAHAWVKVYFPEHGWVEFDPTPSAEREEVRETRLVEARGSGTDGVDVEETAPEEESSDEEPTDADDDAAEDAAEDDDSITDNETVGGVDRSDVDSQEVPAGALEADGLSGSAAEAGASNDSPVPSREVLGYWLFVVIVAVAGAHHVGATNRVYRAAWLRLPQRRRSPERDTERAFARLEYLLGRRYRERRPGETPRSYLEALRIHGVDDRVHAVGAAYERAMYAGSVSRADADEARRTVRRLALESTPVVGRLFGRTEAE